MLCTTVSYMYVVHLYFTYCYYYYHYHYHVHSKSVVQQWTVPTLRISKAGMPTLTFYSFDQLLSLYELYYAMHRSFRRYVCVHFYITYIYIYIDICIHMLSTVYIGKMDDFELFHTDLFMLSL